MSLHFLIHVFCAMENGWHNMKSRGIMLADESRCESDKSLNLIKCVFSLFLDKASLCVHAFLIVVNDGKSPQVNIVRLKDVNSLGASLNTFLKFSKLFSVLSNC